MVLFTEREGNVYAQPGDHIQTENRMTTEKRVCGKTCLMFLTPTN